MLSDSCILEPWSRAYFINLLEVIGFESEVELKIAGRRKGSVPVGEAWLLEAIRQWSMPAILRKV
jgi:hypothetical protein